LVSLALHDGVNKWLLDYAALLRPLAALAGLSER
jgi:hypothetical protein